MFIGKLVPEKAGDKNTLIGNPTVEGAKVMATSLGEAKGEKVIVFKYKSKVRYRNKRGHRQTYTKILVNEIIKAGAESPRSLI